MKDIPVFTSEYGVASLILREIPYRQEAYICIQSSCQPGELLEECVGFCRACGAEKIYARNHEYLEKYPLHTAILKMRGIAQVDSSKVEKLWPVTKETVSRWREFMNDRMRNVDNAGTLVKQGEQELLDRGGAYFVHRNGELLGGGWLTDGELLLIAAAVPGAGERVMHTLMSLQPDRPLELEVASTNIRAIGLYERLGFVKTAELRKWYKIFPSDK